MMKREDLIRELEAIKDECERHGLSVGEAKKLIQSLLAIPAVMPLALALFLKAEWVPGGEQAVERYKEVLDEWLRAE
jgi:hypothetical protein